MDLLSQIYLFKSLSEDQRAWVGRLATIQKSACGESIFRQGDKANALYIVKYGGVVIKRRTHDSEELEIVRLDAGAHFGEISLLTQSPRTATAETTEPTELVLLGYEKLRRLLEDQPLIGAKVYRAMAGQLSGKLAHTTEDLTFIRVVSARR